MGPPQQPVDVEKGEPWTFESGWNLSEGSPATIKVHLPAWNEQTFEATRDHSRTLHGSDFPAQGTLGYVLGHASFLPHVLQAQKSALTREEAGEAPEWVTVQESHDLQHHTYRLNGLIQVCGHALQQGCVVLVDHND